MRELRRGAAVPWGDPLVLAEAMSARPLDTKRLRARATKLFTALLYEQLLLVREITVCRQAENEGPNTLLWAGSVERRQARLARTREVIVLLSGNLAVHWDVVRYLAWSECREDYTTNPHHRMRNEPEPVDDDWLERFACGAVRTCRCEPRGVAERGRCHSCGRPFAWPVAGPDIGSGPTLSDGVLAHMLCFPAGPIRLYGTRIERLAFVGFKPKTKSRRTSEGGTAARAKTLSDEEEWTRAEAAVIGASRLGPVPEPLASHPRALRTYGWAPVRPTADGWGNRKGKWRPDTDVPEFRRIMNAPRGPIPRLDLRLAVAQEMPRLPRGAESAELPAAA
jgi:hypothetical protein